MRSRLAAMTLTAMVSFSSAASADDQTPSRCDPSFELGPSFILPEGYKVFIDPDQPMACIGDTWFENYPQMKGDEVEMCRVGHDGLDVGPGPFGQYYDDPETGRKADKRIFICRDQNGECFICPDLTS